MSLTLKNVTISVADGNETNTLLDDVSLEVASGEVLCLTGASGSGKSTLLAAAGLLRQPDAGNVIISGDDTTALSRKQKTKIRKKSIGFVFQSSNLFPSLTALEQVELVAHINGHLGKTEKQEAKDLLVSLGLESRLHNRPAQLSGGERQRVGIARALMNDPAVLLCDEPTASLDEERGFEIMELLVNQAREHKAATLIVTHAPQQLAGERKTLELAKGKLVTQ
jgi:putative ABC transport system ATP-binding protein